MESTNGNDQSNGTPGKSLVNRQSLYQGDVTVWKRRQRQADQLRDERRQEAEERQRAVFEMGMKLREALLKLKQNLAALLQKKTLIEKQDSELTSEMQNWDPPLEHEDELRTDWWYAFISLAICAFFGIAGGVLAFEVMRILLPTLAIGWRWFFAGVLGFLVMYALHTAAEACFRKGKDGRPQFPKVVFAILVVLVLATGLWVSALRGELESAKAKQQAGELQSGDAQKTTDRLEGKSKLAHILLLLSIEACGAVAGSYGTGMMRYVRPRVQQYAKRRNYEQQKCEIATQIDQSNLEIQEKEKQLDDLQKGNNLCVITWNKPIKPPPAATSARLWRW